MISIVSSKLMFSSGEYHTDIVLFYIADINRNLNSFAIFKSDIYLGIILKQSNILFDSMFHNFILSLEAAKRNSEFSSKKDRCVIGELSTGVMFMLLNCSRSQYLTVLSLDPLANAKFYGLYSKHVTY